MIKRLSPNRNSNFKQGYYTPKNKHKYIGDKSKIIYRSSWEKTFMEQCDKSNNILEWSSEPTAITYTSPIDNKSHKYYVDFYIKIQNKNGDIEQKLVEIKPKQDYQYPVFEGYKTEKKLKRHVAKLKTYLINMAKFKAASYYAEKINMKFIVLNEDNLYF